MTNFMTEQKEKPKDKMAGYHNCVGCVALKFHKNNSPFCAVGIYHDCVVSGRIMKFVYEEEKTT